MKYEQLLVGLLAGVAITMLAQNGGIPGAGGVDRSQVESIVKDVIAKEPKLIIDSVQKYQMDQHNHAAEDAGKALKDSSLHKAIYEDPNSAFIGPKDAKKVVVEYFDYDCPVCKMMFKNITQLKQEHADVKVIFKEFPIFGPASDANAKLGFAIWHLYPEKYFAFFSKMMATPGHGDAKNPPKFVADLGMDMKKLQAYANSSEVDAMLKATRAQGDALHIQGTPTMIVGEEVIPHYISYDELVQKLGVTGEKKPAKADDADSGDAEKSE